MKGGLAALSILDVTTLLWPDRCQTSILKDDRAALPMLVCATSCNRTCTAKALAANPHASPVLSKWEPTDESNTPKCHRQHKSCNGHGTTPTHSPDV
eukprot:14694687-Alexandrium_andersonii.AAC.1